MNISAKYDFNSKLRLIDRFSPNEKRIFYVDAIIQRYLTVQYELVDIAD